MRRRGFLAAMLAMPFMRPRRGVVVPITREEIIFDRIGKLPPKFIAMPARLGKTTISSLPIASATVPGWKKA